MVLESDGRSFQLDLHEQFTVVAGLEPAERRSLTQALVSAMGPGRAGLHLEAVTDTGRHLAVFRPPGLPARVIDVDEAKDVSAAFAGSDGRPDLAGACGVTKGEEAQTFVLTAADLESRSSVERRIVGLARVDQGRVWEVASKVEEREAALAVLGGDPDDVEPELLSAVDDRHRAFEAAQAEHERAQRVWLLFGANAVLLALPVAILVGWWAAFPILAAAVAMTAWSFRQWRTVEHARDAEHEALEKAGARSYMAFQIARLDRVLDSENHHREMGDAAAAHRAALAEWELLAGDVELTWALAHRDEIKEAARRLRANATRENPMALTLSPAEEGTAEHLARLRSRLAVTQPQSPESLPLFCDDPLIELRQEVKPSILEELVRASENRQVVLLTGDPDVAAWARVEALTGEVGLVEAAPVR